ncbi:MAG: tetratricopeptide repeat protein, partial [Anaerolineae bacterium]
PQAPDRAREMLEDLLKRTDEKALWSFYEQTLEKFPEDTDWMMRAGLFAMQSGRLETARELLKKAWDRCPQEADDAAKLDLYLESLLQSGQYEALIAAARPYTEGPFAAVAYAQMAQAHKKMGSGVQALSLYHQALEHCGTDHRLMLGVLQNMSQVVGTAEVEKWCRARLQANPDALSPNLMMFILNRRAGEYNTALGYISACMRIVGPEDPMWTRLAIDKSNVLIQAYVKTSDKQYLLEGIATLEDILQVQPQNSTVLNNLAYLLADNNERLDEAVEYARQAMDLRPDDPVLMDTYAYTLVKAGRFEEAERMAQMAIHYHEMSKPDAPWDAYEHLGMAQEGLGKKADAKVAYERALHVGNDSLTQTDRQELEEAIQRVSE